MTNRYIPPRLRNAEPSSTSTFGHENQKPSRSSQPIEGQSQSSSASPASNLSNIRTDRFAREEIHNHYGRRGFDDRSTLNDSAATPGQLAYVILYHDANPRWESDRIIFVKSNLGVLTDEVLPVIVEEAACGVGEDGSGVESAAVGDGMAAISVSDAANEKDMSSPSRTSNADIPSNEDHVITGEATRKNLKQQPIAVFRQLWRGQERSIGFEAWFRISRIERLAPNSSELIRMLEQKWALSDQTGELHYRERKPESWTESLSHNWAVLKLEECEEQLPAPEIKLLELEFHSNARRYGQGNRYGGGRRNNDWSRKWRGKNDQINEDNGGPGDAASVSKSSGHTGDSNASGMRVEKDGEQS